MARNLSAQFLGPNHVIDMIPHTALIVFQKEYFFGGGIQMVDPHVYRSFTGRTPVRTQRLGMTNVSQAEFESWCRNVASIRFNVHSYDLLQRNCNHFTHEAMIQGLKLPQSVYPNWILEVPRTFMASPMGQMIRPMLDQMQVTSVPPVTGSGFATMGSSSSSNNSNSNNNTTTPAAANPWANMSSSTTTPNTTTTTATAEKKRKAPPEPTPTTIPPKPTVSILNKFTKPMVSKDTKSIPICVSKVSSQMTDDHAKNCLKQLGTALSSASASLDPTVVETAAKKLLALVKEESSVATFALLLLRLVVLEYGNSKAVRECIDWIVGQSSSSSSSYSSSSPDGGTTGWKTPAARSLAWCVVSNYYSTPVATTTQEGTSTTNTLSIDAAISDLHHDTKQVRQAASTVLYNYVLGSTGNDADADDTRVSVLCSCLENLSEETDDTTRLRRLVTGGRIVFPDSSTINEIAKTLVQDLGFVEVMTELATVAIPAATTTTNNNNKDNNIDSDGKKCQQLAAELIHKLQD